MAKKLPAKGIKPVAKKPEEVQLDFFVPSVFDVATKDQRTLMDVAIFRLSKKDKRASEIIRYEVSGGYVEVISGPLGMASIWDYDIVLMAISDLTEAANQWKRGYREKPGRKYRPHAADIAKFCGKGKGGRQADELAASLDRLKATTLKIDRSITSEGGSHLRVTEAVGLLDSYRVVSRHESGRIDVVEISLPEWLYCEIVGNDNPSVLTVHPDYFFIDSGLGRFIYRLARLAAGKTQARWSFAKLHERSGSAASLKEFTRMLRRDIEANDLPEYSLSEVKGRQGGPVLVMTNRCLVSDGAETEGMFDDDELNSETDIIS